MKALLTHTSMNGFIVQPESEGASVDKGFVTGGLVGDSELLLCHIAAWGFCGDAV